MKPGYAALLSLVVAYSAYRGTGSSKPASPQQGSNSSRASTEYAAQMLHPSGVESFPTISGGICKLKVSGGQEDPCGGCKAICPAKELNELLEDFFGAESGRDSAYLATHWNVPKSERANIKFVIASLPDPVHTHMALLFDRGIETIQGAAQSSGYLFSRAWMPWDISTHSESTDFTVRMAQDTFRKQVESLPGLMIFRRADEKGTIPKILFVFVVGETPTGGLHVEQFQNALKVRNSILGGADASPDAPAAESTTLRIFGPGFSGSLRSLDSILNTLPDSQFYRFKNIVIRSGTISSFHAVHDFCESTHSESQERPTKALPDFASFEFSDAYQEYYLGRFFGPRNHAHSKVAILSEDETAFGNQEGTPAKQPSKQPDPCAAEPEPPAQGFQFVRLYFPREIAQLRDAYQRDAKAQTAGTDSAKTPPQSGLTLSLGITGNDDDTVAAFSPLQTPLSQESILQGIVAALRKEHARIVIVRGGDPLDVLFLCRYLRQNFPQARLVTVGADLLMIHDSYDPRFHGILAVTSYPLLTGAEFPVLEGSGSNGKQHIHRLFPDSYAVGDFNAVQSLLAPNSEIMEQTLPAAKYAQFGLPSFLQPGQTEDASKFWRAHLWLVTVGRGSYWPVDVLDDVPPVLQDGQIPPHSSVRTANAKTDPLTVFGVHFTVSWTIFWMANLGLTILLAYLIAYPPNFSGSEILARFDVGKSTERHGLLFTGSMLLLASGTIFAFPAIAWLGRFGSSEDGRTEVSNGLFLMMICYVVSVGLLGAACFKGFQARDHVQLAKAGAAACGGVLIVAIVSTVLLGSATLPDRFGSFVYRFIHISSGVSPLLPLLFLLIAWQWWCWQTLTGVSSTEEKHMLLPVVSEFAQHRVADSDCIVRKGVTNAADRLRLRALGAKGGQWPWKTLGAVPLDVRILIPTFLGIASILLLMWPSEIAESFESRGYKILHWILLYSCLLLVCYLITQIVVVWLQFRALLRAIEKAPFRRGFSDLKGLTWKPLWKLAGNGREEFVQLLSGEVQVLTQIRNALDPNECLAKAIDNTVSARDIVSKSYEEYRKGDDDLADRVRAEFHVMQEKLAIAATEGLIYANERWEKESKSYTPPPETKDCPDQRTPVEPPAKDPTTRGVENFLCLFYLNIILVPLRRLQTLILAMAGVFVFVLISYSSYPFESRESFHVLLISIFFLISLVVGIVYGQMYTNPLLSRITNTKPGELGLDFWVRLGTFVFVPLLSLLSVQFPEINNFLFSWLQPALQSIK
jgi:hypothetical protein